eukprot:4413111-Ditylum_brightwellii.AAC.1
MVNEEGNKTSEKRFSRHSNGHYGKNHDGDGNRHDSDSNNLDSGGNNNDSGGHGGDGLHFTPCS